MDDENLSLKDPLTWGVLIFFLILFCIFPILFMIVGTIWAIFFGVLLVEKIIKKFHR